MSSHTALPFSLPAPEMVHAAVVSHLGGEGCRPHGSGTGCLPLGQAHRGQAMLRANASKVTVSALETIHVGPMALGTRAGTGTHSCPPHTLCCLQEGRRGATQEFLLL